MKKKGRFCHHQIFFDLHPRNIHYQEERRLLKKIMFICQKIQQKHSNHLPSDFSHFSVESK